MTSSLLPAPVSQLIRVAAPVLRIRGLAGRSWTRKVPANDARFGPWQQASYDVLDQAEWQRKGACLYLVTGRDDGLRYVGISRNGLSHRWRVSPAIDAQTGEALRERQLFHSQCWKHLHAEFALDSAAQFTVRCLAASQLVEALRSLDDPISALGVMDDDGETVVAAVERWICNRASASLARWNVAMTGR